jgi:hypothetical protein
MECAAQQPPNDRGEHHEVTNDPEAAEIFRKEALDRLVQQERFDTPIALSAARQWSAFAALLLFAIAALLYLLIG